MALRSSTKATQHNAQTVTEPDAPMVTEPNAEAPVVTEPKADEPKADERKADATPKADALSLDFVAGGAFMLDLSEAPEIAKLQAPKRERSANQQAMDAKVLAAHEQWVKVGRPATWNRMVETKSVVTYFPEPAKAGALKKLINSAAALHNVNARMGSEFPVTEALIKKFGLPAEYLGHTVISFAVIARRARTTKPTDANAAAAPVADGNASDNGEADGNAEG